MTAHTDPEDHALTTSERSHPRCWTGSDYVHTCHEPSGRKCVRCGRPAGTPWGPLFCPECDVDRLDRISANLAALLQPDAGGRERQAEEPACAKRGIGDHDCVEHQADDFHDAVCTGPGVPAGFTCSHPSHSERQAEETP